MKGFIFGRSTIQIMSAIQATFNFIALIIGLTKIVDVTTALIVMNGLGATLAVWVGLLANSGTTPTYDPILTAGQNVSVANSEGTIISKNVQLPTVQDLTGEPEAAQGNDEEEGIV